jgi:hypothetical protein
MTESTAPALWRMLGILAAIIGLAIATCARGHPEPDDTATPDSPHTDGPCWPAEVCHV